MEEIIDVLDENGNKTGKSINKSVAHKEGIWHSSIHILIVSEDKRKTLLQKRCSEKKLYPNTWDIAVGGHVSAGEDTLISAKRELEEELGLNPNEYNFEFLGVVKEQLVNGGVISNEFVNIYVIYYDIDINNIIVQEEEVSEVKWVNLLELNEIVENKVIVPHIEDFKILNNIMIK